MLKLLLLLTTTLAQQQYTCHKRDLIQLIGGPDTQVDILTGT